MYRTNKFFSDIILILTKKEKVMEIKEKIKSIYDDPGITHKFFVEQARYTMFLTTLSILTDKQLKKVFENQRQIVKIATKDD